MARACETKVTYIACDATPEAEPNVLVAVYRFILDCRARKRPLTSRPRKTLRRF